VRHLDGLIEHGVECGRDIGRGVGREKETRRSAALQGGDRVGLNALTLLFSLATTPALSVNEMMLYGM
jgi:hypothetical protein